MFYLSINGRSNEALPQPISKEKEKEHKKTKSKTLTTIICDKESAPKGVGKDPETGLYTVIFNVSDQIRNKKSGWSLFTRAKQFDI